MSIYTTYNSVLQWSAPKEVSQPRICPRTLAIGICASLTIAIGLVLLVSTIQAIAGGVFLGIGCMTLGCAIRQACRANQQLKNRESILAATLTAAHSEPQFYNQQAIANSEPIGSLPLPIPSSQTNGSRKSDLATTIAQSNQLSISQIFHQIADLLHTYKLEDVSFETSLLAEGKQKARIQACKKFIPLISPHHLNQKRLFIAGQAAIKTTALHFTLIYHQPPNTRRELIQLLITHGAKVTEASLTLAEQTQDAHLVEILKQNPTLIAPPSPVTSSKAIYGLSKLISSHTFTLSKAQRIPLPEEEQAARFEMLKKLIKQLPTESINDLRQFVLCKVVIQTTLLLYALSVLDHPERRFIIANMLIEKKANLLTKGECLQWNGDIPNIFLSIPHEMACHLNDLKLIQLFQLTQAQTIFYD